MYKKLYLSDTDKKLGGVCGGIAEYLGVDATIIRIAWVLLAFAAGSSIFAYILAWFIMPRRQFDTTRQW
jgi:phage shock protein C